MITFDNEQLEVEVIEKKDEEKAIKFKKIYKIMRKITENSLRGRTGEC